MELAKNLIDIVAWMGERYRDKIKAWWFDSAYSLDLRGPHNSVTTDLAGFQFPWERFTVAAKIGYPARLVVSRRSRQTDQCSAAPSASRVRLSANSSDAPFR